ncbi:integrase family protein [Xylanimonas cellulosilytica DSM 15894]|uniref:Integrase family protein n=1 Tax=Xylanimonas cellulosilytica (strain DSM 15894 / JCM 12276 / CECT 5975 / KCTC 9989 / LMG 20990 / NBRC 107835 / XIL07) TaxID=446471 RepID=D1BWQ4_XYLCX|nr:site-specific integrase [Xylanimonas cellulosilytica]ACZ29636.1 integrase family protein [Xylanimonas cellulosilytica DSM 15894]
MSKENRVAYGTGSVYQRASDHRWVGALIVGTTIRGTTRRVTVSAKCTCKDACRGTGRCGGEAEVKRRLRKKRQEIERDGAPAEGVRAGATVKAWTAVWLAEHKKHARPKYYATDASLVRHWIVPAIGTRRLTDLTPADVRAVTHAVTSAGRSTTTANAAQGCLLRILRAAVAEGHPVPQRVFLTKAPKLAVSDRDAIPNEQAKQLLAHARTLDDGSRWIAALLNGMRQGECLGLTWDRVSFDKGTLDVDWQLQALPYEHGCAGGDKAPTCERDRPASCTSRRFRVPDGYESRHLHLTWHLVRPKSKAGWRVIPLTPWMEAALREWQPMCPDNPWGLVWPAVRLSRGKTTPRVLPQTPNRDREAWEAIQAALGITHESGRRYLLHEARHTTANLLLEAGVDPEVVKAIMGHSSIVTSRGYMHANHAMKKAALEKSSSLLIDAGPADAA